MGGTHPNRSAARSRCSIPSSTSNELPDDAPPNYQLQSAVELALTDSEAKRPGAAANVREAAVPKPPLAKGRKTKPAKDK